MADVGSQILDELAHIFRIPISNQIKHPRYQMNINTMGTGWWTKLYAKTIIETKGKQNIRTSAITLPGTHFSSETVKGITLLFELTHVNSTPPPLPLGIGRE